MGAHQADGLMCVIGFIGERIVSVVAETVAENDCVYAVVVKEGNEFRGFVPTLSVLCPPPGPKNDSRSRVNTSLTRWISMEGL